MPDDSLEELSDKANEAGYYLVPHGTVVQYSDDEVINGSSRMLGVVLFGMFMFALGAGVAFIVSALT